MMFSFFQRCASSRFEDGQRHLDGDKVLSGYLDLTLIGGDAMFDLNALAAEGRDGGGFGHTENLGLS
jgi:hypothetical protein